LPDVPILDRHETDENNDFFPTGTILAIVFPALLIVLVAVIACMRHSHLKRMDKMARNPDFGGATDCELAGLRATAVGDSTLKEYQKGVQDASNMTSGSGSGMQRLFRRHFAKDIQLKEKIGGGRYGEVWLGSWNEDDVAVKIFTTRDEASFLRETRIYSTVLIRHDNILVYYGHDSLASTVAHKIGW